MVSLKMDFFEEVLAAADASSCTSEAGNCHAAPQLDQLQMAMPSMLISKLIDGGEDIEDLDLEIEISANMDNCASHDEATRRHRDTPGRKGSRSVPCQGAKVFSIGAIRFE